MNLDFLILDFFILYILTSLCSGISQIGLSLVMAILLSMSFLVIVCRSLEYALNNYKISYHRGTEHAESLFFDPMGDTDRIKQFCPEVTFFQRSLTDYLLWPLSPGQGKQFIYSVFSIAPRLNLFIPCSLLQGHTFFPSPWGEG